MGLLINNRRQKEINVLRHSRPGRQMAIPFIEGTTPTIPIFHVLFYPFFRLPSLISCFLANIPKYHSQKLKEYRQKV